MTTKNDGGPAFPINDDRLPSYVGMSLRDWIAGQAAAHMLGGAVAAKVTVASDQAVQLARAAYVMADAMIAERDK